VSLANSSIAPNTRARPPLSAGRPANVAREKPISIRSVDGNPLIREPKVSPEVYFASFAINLLALALPLSIMQVYDRIIPNRSLVTFTYLLFGLALALVVEFVLKTTRSALLSWHAMHFVRNIEHEAIARLLRAQDGPFELEPAAVHINRYTAAAALGEYHCGQARLVSIDLPFVAISLTVLAIVGGFMVLVPAGLFFLFGALAVGRARKFRTIINTRTIQDNRKYDFIAEVLAGIHTVKSMAMEPQMQRRFERLQQAIAETTMSSILTGQANQTSALLYGSVSQLVVVAIGASQVVDDQLTMGALTCCTLLSGQILQPLLRAISLWTERETVGHRRAEIRSLLDVPPVEAAPSTRVEVEGNIRFENVTFSYSPDVDPALRAVDLSITAGAIVGIKGEDGSGRTTLLRLLRGDIKPTSGRITVDDISTIAPEFLSVRQSIAYVGAAPVIFRGTIMDNLTMFSPERRDFARRMARLFELEATINVLPDGFETTLGEGLGDDLPASTAQQVNIVRALTTNPRILLLDEANSVLDGSAESALLRALDSLRGWLTVVIVSHRPSLLALCDSLLIVQRGQVVCDAPTPNPSESEAP
jgi:ATP-binding cassette, subfamily C, bacterial LapB